LSYTINDLAVLIATKDRLSQLQNLLESICKSSFIPSKVVIVYSGEDITSLITPFRKTLSVEVIYSEIASQIAQKSMGIKSLGSKYEWVFFLDDDLLLEANTIKVMFTEYLANPVYAEYSGFGLSILNRSNRKIGSITSKLLKLFDLYSDTPGTITRSGHAQSYLDHPTETEVNWLNGISVWRSKVLNYYPVVHSNISYSAYEDVEFSYKVGKKSKLLFAPKAKVANQKIEGNSPLTISQFIYGGYLRYRFVFNNIELSKWRLLAAQFFRGLDFIFRPNATSKIALRIRIAVVLWVRLIILIIKNKNPNEIPLR
jgi:GT2 family glycosyltransferase